MEIDELELLVSSSKNFDETNCGISRNEPKIVFKRSTQNYVIFMKNSNNKFNKF